MPLDSYVVELLELQERQGRKRWDQLPVEDARTLFSAMRGLYGDPPDVAEVTDVALDENLTVRHYCPLPESIHQPVILFIHGGGWVLGDLDSHDTLCRRLALDAGLPVLSIDFRRPPEHRFPIPAHDCFDAFKLIHQRAETFNIDPERIILAGDSAGGNLAIATALQAAESEFVDSIRGLGLFYPVIEANFQGSSYLRFAEGFGLTQQTMRWFWSQYLVSEEQKHDPLVNPLRSDRLGRLPPTKLILAEYDVLRDEGHRFAEALKAAGVEVSLTEYAGMIHGFVHFYGFIKSARPAIEEAAAWAKQISE